MSSRRGSFESQMSRSPFVSPFDDSRAPSRDGSDEELLNTQTVSEKYSILPTDDLLLNLSDIEADDYLHNPGPSDNDRDCNIFTKRGFMNLGGLAFFLGGLLILFIVYPAVSYIRRLHPAGSCNSDPMCISADLPLLQNIRSTMIDPDTPKSAMSKKTADGSTWKLVFSDEFNKPGRSFYPEDDPYFEAVNIWYGVTQDLEWYDPDMITTKDGYLEITFDNFRNHDLNYRSGMLQSWNKLCMQGGIIEASISLPGKGEVSGLWPGFWTMGNLGRPGYASTTDGMWPYSYWDQCDVGITPNQSSPDGINFLPGMKLPACTCVGTDHPTAGKSRSAPEIDVLEASSGYLGPDSTNPIGTISQSVQIAPFDIWYQPDYNFVEVYNPQITQLNSYRGGTFQEAFSGLSTLNNDWYDGQAYQVYGFEYTPGDQGNIVWHIGDSKTWKMDARSVGPNGNIGQRVVPKEPMSIIMNLGMSPTFARIDVAALNALYPVHMRINWIRIYQDPNSHHMGCDPVGYETSTYIKKHQKSYQNPNYTSW